MKTTLCVLFLMIPGLILISAGCKKEKEKDDNNNNQQQVNTVKDIEGNIYKTVKIGDQWWMAENLKTTRYNDNSSIPLVTDNVSWSNLVTPGYCWYNNDQSTYGSVYGALYSWHAVATEKLCPKGWHVPFDQEWKALEIHLGMTQYQADLTDWRGNDEGGKLKEAGTTHWNAPNAGATNSSGFTALGGGGRNADDGTFGFLGYYGFWWSPSPFSISQPWYRDLDHSTSLTGRSCSKKNFGFSVRCIKDS